jgi:hypothetical protein
VTYQIEKGIPISPQTHAPKVDFPLDDLERFDSFAVEISLADRVRSAIVYNTRKTKKVFTTRKIGDLIRVWRIA